MSEASVSRQPGRAGHGGDFERRHESLGAKILIAGGVSAFVGGSLNPIDVTKIRIQNQPSSAKLYSGMLDAMLKILRDEGWRGLTRGYEPVRQLLAHSTDDPANSSPLIKFAAALLTGGVGSALANPLDLIKTRFQALLPGEVCTYSTTFNAFAVIYKANAVLTSAQLGSYDSIKHNLLMNVFGIEDGFRLHLGAAMSAGLITTTAANPFDVIKTRYLSDRDHRYRSVLDCIRQTYRAEGAAGFMKGWTPAYWRIGPHTLLTLLLIEEIRAYLGMSTL